MENSPQIGESTPLGVFANEQSVYLFHTLPGNDGNFQVDRSDDGFSFGAHTSDGKIVDEKRRKINPQKSLDFRISAWGDSFLLTYKYQKERYPSLFIAKSRDLVRWARVSRIENVRDAAVIVPNHQHEGRHIMLYGEHSVHIAFSKDLITWEDETTILHPHQDFYGTWPLKIATAAVTNEGIYVLYYVMKANHHVAIHAAILDKANPKTILHSFAEPIWESPAEWEQKDAYPLGLVFFRDHCLSYWVSDRDGVFTVAHAVPQRRQTDKAGFPAFLLSKFKDNPIIKPIADHFWESRATFNPAALYEKGKVHLIYRAIGDTDVSVMGYASSGNGYDFDRFDAPAYVPSEPFEGAPVSRPTNLPYSPWASGGGGAGGSEDPRLTKIGDTIYMTYVAYDGWSAPRVAMTSIPADDFFAQKWNWKKPVLISKPNEVNKNACILPEKIDGKYVIFHRVFPDILVDYVDDLAFDGQTRWLAGHEKISPRRGFWDSRKVGVGATPIKTPYGWLLIYQAVGDADPSRYKMGAMLLDPASPSHVLHRSVTPILEPNEWYENEGYKAGVAYPCGAVIKDKELLVYYGGADSVTCVANAPVDEFLQHLVSQKETHLAQHELRVVTH